MGERAEERRLARERSQEVMKKFPDGFDEVILINSTPYSGNTYTRHLVEILTGYESLGWPLTPHSGKAPESEKGIILKSHGWTEDAIRHCAEDPQKFKAIHLIRNPIEYFCRIERETVVGSNHKDQFRAWLKGKWSYQLHFEKFMSLDCEKTVVFYEDLVTNPVFFLKQIHDILPSTIRTPQEVVEYMAQNGSSSGSMKAYPHRRSNPDNRAFRYSFSNGRRHNREWWASWWDIVKEVYSEEVWEMLAPTVQAHKNFIP